MRTATMHDEIGSGVAGVAGGLVRWARSPDGRLGLLVALVSGGGCGYLGNALIKYFRPELPEDVRIGSAFLCGVVSAIWVEISITLAHRARLYVQQLAARRLPTDPTGSPTDGRHDPARPTPAPPDTE